MGNFKVVDPSSGETTDVIVTWQEDTDGILPHIKTTAGQEISYVTLSMSDQQRIHDYIMKQIHAQDPNHPGYQAETQEPELDEASSASHYKHTMEVTIDNPEPFPDNGTEEEQDAWPIEIDVDVKYNVYGHKVRQGAHTRYSPSEDAEAEFEIFKKDGQKIPLESIDKATYQYIESKILDTYAENAAADYDDYRYQEYKDRKYDMDR